MKRWVLAVVASLLLVSVVPVYAGGFGAEVGVLGKAMFGYNGLISPDVTTPTEYSYNPAVFPTALTIGGGNYAESDYGRYDFSAGPDIQTIWAYAALKVGQEQAIRIGRYTTSSSPAPAWAFGEDLKVGFSTETIELAYARKVGKGFYAGISISPETANTKIEVMDTAIAKAEAKSDLNYRLGAYWTASEKVALGATYTCDKLDSKLEFYDMETGQVAGISEGEYKEELLTIGATYSPLKGTCVAISHQGGKLRGPNLDEDVDLMSYGLTQYINEKVCLILTYSEGGWTYTGQYRDAKWCYGATIGTNVYSQSEEFVGSANSFYLWAGKTF